MMRHNLVRWPILVWRRIKESFLGDEAVIEEGWELCSNDLVCDALFLIRYLIHLDF